MSTLYDEVKRTNIALVEAVNTADKANDDAEQKTRIANAATTAADAASLVGKEANAAVLAAFDKQVEAFAALRPKTPPVTPPPATPAITPAPEPSP